MARVVQRRSNPPYLLIIFVFLFVISTALAVMFYLRADKESKAAKDLEASITKLAGEGEVRDKALAAADAGSGGNLVQQKSDDVAKVMGIVAPGSGSTPEKLRKIYDKALIGEGRPVAQWRQELEKDSPELVADITANGLFESMAAAEKLRNIGVTPVAVTSGLFGAVKTANESMLKLAQDKQALDVKIADLDKQIAANATALTDLSKKYAGQVGELEKTLNAKIAEFDAARNDFVKGLADAAAKNEAAIKDHAASIAEKTGQIDRMQAGTQQKDIVIAKLQDEVKRLKAGTKIDADKTTDPDGKIQRVLEAEKICYIDLGSKDKLNVGMTFAVFPAAGVGREANPKAKIRVTRVDQLTSECTIAEEDPKNPIAAGDLLVNLVFDPVRNYTFVVDGTFDLYGTGTPTTEGAEEVKEMITRAGGKIVAALDYRTDYVVLGEEPTIPTKPAEGDSAQLDKLYRDKLKAAAQFKEVRDGAKAMGLPVMNANRFLALMGHVPPKAPK